ncbi:MAG: phage/plasmid primase, P4 family [Mycobacterium sp.]
MSIANIDHAHGPRPAASAQEVGPVCASKPLPVPEPHEITRTPLTVAPPPVKTKVSMIAGIAPDEIVAPPILRGRATTAAPAAPPTAASTSDPGFPESLQQVEAHTGSAIVGIAPTVSAPVPTPAEGVEGARWLLEHVHRLAPGERVTLCHQQPGRAFIAEPLHLEEVLRRLPALASSEVWVTANATNDVGRKTNDITRLASLYADLDVKREAFPSKEDAAAAIAELAAILGVPPTAVVDSGGGLQPYWPLDGGEIRSEEDCNRVKALLRGWGRLVAAVAAGYGAGVDPVFDPARVLRVPGSWNLKAVYGEPRLVVFRDRVSAPLPEPLTLDALEALFEAHGHLADPRANQGGEGGPLATLTPPEWPEECSAWSAAVIAAWESDPPENGRHSWHLDRATRLAAMAACGCLTEDAYTEAVVMLDARLDHFRAGDGSSDPWEAGRNWDKAEERTASRTVGELFAEELGGHTHDGPAFGELRAVTPEYLDELAAGLDADADAGVTTVPRPAAGGVSVAVEVGREGLFARATRCRAAAETMRRGGRATTAVQLPVGLPAVHPMLGDYRQRAVNELGSSQFDIDWTIPAADLIPNDLRPLREAVHGPRATDKPLVLPAEEATCAQAIAKAVGGWKLARDVERSGTRDFLLSWAGSCWVKDGDAGEVCVQALMHPHLLDTDPAVRQQKIVVFGTRKPDTEEEAEQRQAAMQAAQARGVVFDPSKWRPRPVPFEDRAWATSDSRTRAIARRVSRQLEVAVPDTNMFDADPFVVGTPGGYLLLGDTVTAIAPDPARLVTKLMGAAYDPEWTRARWLKFMSEFQPDPEVLAFLQRLAGAALVGRQDEHILPNLSGEGGNGKGVFLEILRYAFGGYGVMMQTKVLTVAGSRGHAADLMPLKGARLAVFNEVPGVQLDAEQLKIINGGGAFSARGIAENPIEFPLSHMSWMSTNNLLEVAPGNRRAIRRRLRQIPCRADFSGLAGSSKPIVGLAEKIWEAEGPGIVAWIVEGYLDYRRRGGLDVPAAIDAATDEALAATSTWSAFCDEAFQVTRRKEDVIDVSPIFTAWRHYRGETSDQAHSRPGNERAVPKLLAQELHGIWTEPSRGRQRARAVGLVWTDDGKELLKEATSGPVPFRPTAP